MNAAENAEVVHAVESATERAVSYAAVADEPAEDLPDALRQIDAHLSEAETYLNWLREEQIRLLVLLADMDVAVHFEEMDPDYAPRGRVISTAITIDINSAAGNVRQAREGLRAMRPVAANGVSLAGGTS